MKSHASLNCLFRLLWSQVQHGWVPVAEAARGATKGRYRALTTLPLLMFASTTQGGPDGGQVISGTGTIAQSGETTTISQSSQNLSLTWQSFDVGAQEAVNFEQPSASAMAVNRIFDTNGTQILGRLNANGQVYLINSNGVLFGQGAQVNVGGLVASTLDIDDPAGDVKHFEGNGTGTVVNHGEITTVDGGYVALLGNRVSNQGSINVPLGSVALGAGNAITLTFQNNSLLSMQVDESVLNSAADNGGLIRADGGMVVMSSGAKDALLASVVNNTGVIEARTVEHRDGSIVLLGGMEAGTVNVAGTLDASAPEGGDGGFIDTSAAHVKIADDATITTAATSGRTGTWLIDPVDFTIAASGGDITGATLSNSLTATDVIIESVNGSTGILGDVNVNDVVLWSANRLTLNAENNINVNANLDASGTASLALEYGQAAVAAGNTSDVIINGAAINLPAGTTSFTTRQGSDGPVKAYTVITALGAEGSTTTTDLQGMNGDLTLNYALGSNIDAAVTFEWNAGAGFIPIGNSATRFTGSFDGLGHTISQLTINRTATAYVGLFGYTNTGALIQNVGLLDSNIQGANYAGGLVGRHAGGTVRNSYFSGDVKRYSSNGNYVGGLVGMNEGTISNSFADANVGGSSHVGGLVGNNAGVIQGSYAVGTLLGSNRLGGLVGVNAGGGSITSSYSSVAVSSNFFNQDLFGGLVGQNSGSISESYANGIMVVNQSAAGGLVGHNSGSVTTSFWDVDITGQVTSAAGIGLSSIDMQTEANFTSATVANGSVDPAWDFSDTWLFTNGSNAPLLNALLIDVTVSADNVSKTYDGNIYSGGYSATVDGHLPGTLSYSGNSQSAINASSYVIAVDTEYANKQYVITAVNGTLTINPADLTVSSSDVSKIYDGGLSAAGTAIITRGSLFGSDALSGGSFAFTDKNVGEGNKIVTTSGVTVNDGNSGNNYNLSYISNTTSTISAADLFVTGVSASSRSYDGTVVAALSGTATVAALGSDNLSVDTNGSGLFIDQHVAIDKAVTVNGYNLTGSDAANYRIIQPTGLTADITPANLSLSTSDVSRIYDGGLSAAGSVIISSGTLFGSDSISGGSFSFTDKNVGEGNKIVTTSGVIVNDGNSGNNYNLSYVDNTNSSISAASLAVAGLSVSDKPYDGTTTATLVGAPSVAAFGSDSVSVTGTGLAVFSDPDIGADKAVAVSGYSLGGADANNYLLVQPSGLMADITAAFIPLPVSRIASQVTSLLSLPPPSAPLVALNPAPADSSTATNIASNPGEPGSTVRVVNGGVSLPDNWNSQ